MIRKAIWSMVFPDHFHFLLSRHLLDLPLPAHRFFLRVKFLIISQNYRPAGFCIFRAFSVVVGFDPLLQIIRPAGVERTVTAFDNICIIHVRHLFLLAKRRYRNYIYPVSAFVGRITHSAHHTEDLRRYASRLFCNIFFLFPQNCRRLVNLVRAKLYLKCAPFSARKLYHRVNFTVPIILIVVKPPPKCIGVNPQISLAQCLK